VLTPLLELEHVGKTYATGALLTRKAFAAVGDVSLSLAADQAEVFTLIGESGSGKTTLARIMLNLIEPSRGVVRFRGRDLARMHRRDQRLAFMREVQPVFQNPFAAFNPLTRVERYLFSTATRLSDARTAEQLSARVDESLQLVGLSLDEVRHRFPHELSGGQLQRVAIARALIPRPALIVADEPVSMVDASLRMSIIKLFQRLRDELGVSIVYVTHDLATAYYISDRLVVMRRGAIVEAGDARTVLTSPQHPYTQMLKDAVLSPDPAAAAPLLPVSEQQVSTNASER
jgi:peptide/nickel transport system ATP-binding protein